MRFVADTADFPAICHVSDAKDITRNRRETSLRYKQFGKGIVKYNAFKQLFTLFCSISEPKGISFTLWIFRWRIFDRRDVLYALGNDKVENDQPPEAANVLYWFEKVPYLLCWKLGRTLPSLCVSNETNFLSRIRKMVNLELCCGTETFSLFVVAVNSLQPNIS